MRHPSPSAATAPNFSLTRSRGNGFRRPRKPPTFLAHCPTQIDIEFLHSAPHGHSGYAKQSGGFRLVSARLFQGVDELPFLNFVCVDHEKRSLFGQLPGTENRRREMGGLDQGLMTCDKGVFKGAPELPDIPGPVIHHHARHGLIADAPDRLAALHLSPFEEGVCKQGNILDPLSQGRQPDGNHVDPEKQIVPEGPFVHKRL